MASDASPGARRRTAAPCSAPDVGLLPDAQAAALGAAGQDLYQRLCAASQRDDLAGVLDACARIKQQLRSVPPPAPAAEALKRCAYRALMAGVARRGLASEALAVLADMEQAGVQADAHVLDAALAACAAAGDVRLDELLERVERAHLAEDAGSSAGTSTPPHRPLPPPPADLLDAARVRAWRPSTYTHLLHYACRTRNVEYAALLVSAALAGHVPLDHDALQHALQTAVAAREARLGLELLDALEATGAHVPPALWMQALRAAAQDDYVGMGRSDSASGDVALERAWRRSVTEGGLLPDEGLLLHVLHAAGRAGCARFAQEVLEALPQLLPGIELHEWHLSPVLDAQCRTGDFAGAIATLQRMAERGITLVAGVAAALQRRAAASASHLAAARAALESAPRVPRAALHALLYAAAQRRDAASAEAMYAAVCAPGRGALVPSAETHEARLLACLEAGDWAAGERAWAEAAERGTPLSAVAYERMARLALRQETYEEAFRLLETAKQQGLVPTRRTYASLVWTCWQRGDERWHAVLGEMREAGYVPSDRFREAVRQTVRR